MMLFTLGGFFKSIISLFKTRVLNDGGNFEAETNLENQLNTLGSDLFDSASLVITPNGVKTSKLYSIKPNDGTGDLTVVRNTSATRIDENGNIVYVLANVARIDYSNGSPAILVEPQRTNLVQRSEELNVSPWGTLGTITITPNNTVSPNGDLTADLVLGAHNSSSVNQIIVGSVDVVYTNSFFIKNNNSTQSGLTIRNNITALQSQLNWSGSVLTSITNIVGISTFKYYGNGWYRIISTYTSIETIQRPRFLPTLSTNQSVFIWGAQLEVGSNATSYIPTTTSAVTRNADVISKTGLSGIASITETFENGTTNVISGNPTSYTMSQGRIKQVIGL